MIGDFKFYEVGGAQEKQRKHKGKQHQQDTGDNELQKIGPPLDVQTGPQNGFEIQKSTLLPGMTSLF